MALPSVTLNTPDETTFYTPTPTLEFTGTDPEADDVTYEIQIDDTDDTFGSLVVTALSETDPGFENLDTPADEDPFNSGEKIKFIAQLFSEETEDIYRFDGHDGITDSHNAWDDDANGFSDNANTIASTTTVGSSSTNYLQGDGTLAPTDSDAIIVKVESMYHCGDAGGHLGIAHIYSDDEDLGASGKASDQPDVFNLEAAEWLELTPPTGGWTWQKINELSLRIWGEENIYFQGGRLTFGAVKVTYKEPIAFPENTYHWRVRAKDPSGSDEWGEWSEVREFVIAQAPSFDPAIARRRLLAF